MTQKAAPTVVLVHGIPDRDISGRCIKQYTPLLPLRRTLKGAGFRVKTYRWDPGHAVRAPIFLKRGDFLRIVLPEFRDWIKGLSLNTAEPWAIIGHSAGGTLSTGWLKEQIEDNASNLPSQMFNLAAPVRWPDEPISLYGLCTLNHSLVGISEKPISESSDQFDSGGTRITTFASSGDRSITPDLVRLNSLALLPAQEENPFHPLHAAFVRSSEGIIDYTFETLGHNGICSDDRIIHHIVQELLSL